MRLSVRPSMKINLSFGFSRNNRCAPDISKGEMLYQLSNHFSIQYDSMVVKKLLKRKENSFQDNDYCLQIQLCYHKNIRLMVQEY